MPPDVGLKNVLRVVHLKILFFVVTKAFVDMDFEYINIHFVFTYDIFI